MCTLGWSAFCQQENGNLVVMVCASAGKRMCTGNLGIPLQTTTLCPSYTLHTNQHRSKNFTVVTFCKDVTSKTNFETIRVCGQLKVQIPTWISQGAGWDNTHKLKSQYHASPERHQEPNQKSRTPRTGMVEIYGLTLASNFGKSAMLVGDKRTFFSGKIAVPPPFPC